MNAKDLMNMDMETAIQWLRHALRWWIDELMGMLPPVWRERFTKRSRVVAEFHGDAFVYHREGSDETLPAKPGGAIKLLLPPEAVLVRQIDLPLVPMSDVKRMVALDIDRLTPFESGQIFFDTEIVTRDPDSGRQEVALGVLPREAAVDYIEHARQNNLVPAAMGVAPRDGGIGGGFDFLSAMREAEGGDAAQRRSLYWWAGAAALLAINLVLLVYRDSNNLDQLRQAVDAQQAPVSVALRTRDKVDRETLRRTALLESKRRSSPLPVLDAVTSVMPADAWVHRFEWNGRTVHVIGTRKTSPDILARLEASPILKNAHSLSTDTHATAAGQQFDMAVDRDETAGAPR